MPATKYIPDTPKLEAGNPRANEAKSLWLRWGLLILLGFLGRLLYGYEVDELMHLHTAWSIGQGRVPYRDFYDNHLPVWHYLLAPFVSPLTTASVPVLITIRLFALGILLLELTGFYHLLRRTAPETACWGVGVFLLMHPVSTIGLELRPDWTALACLIGALLLFFGAVRSEAKQENLRAFTGGLLCGLALGMTQKTLPLLLGLGGWFCSICFYAPDPATRYRRLSCALLALLGGCVPISLCLLVFLRNQALPDLLKYGILLNLRWGREAPIFAGAQESVMVLFPIFALAFTRLAQVAWTVRFREAAPETLAAALFLTGFLGFLCTPVPLGQWFLFLVVPWVSWLGVHCLTDLIRQPERFITQRHKLIGGSLAAFLWIFGGVTLTNLGQRCLHALAILVVWGFLWHRFGKHLLEDPTEATRRARAFRLLLSIAFLMYVGRSCWEISLGNGIRQQQFIAIVERKLSPRELALAPWPNLVPFRHAPTYHVFAIGGIYQTLDVEALQEEHIRALRQKTIPLVIMRPQDVDTWEPRFAEYVRSHFMLQRAETINLRRVELYTRK